MAKEFKIRFKHDVGSTEDNPKRPRAANLTTGVELYVQGQGSRTNWVFNSNPDGSSTAIMKNEGIQGTEIILSNVAPEKEFSLNVAAVSYDGDVRLDDDVDVYFAPYEEE